MRCPKCKNKVIQKVGDVIRIRSDGPMEFTAGGECRTLCHWCKNPITLPIRLKDEVNLPSERFTIPTKA